MVIRGADKEQVVADVQLHGELVHGYPPVFYEEAHRAMFAKLAGQFRSTA